MAIFRAKMLAAPSAARLKASSTLSIDSSAMIGAGLRWFRRTWPARLMREIGCSIRSMPLSPSTWQARIAWDSSQY
ncbi:hypothetical protein D3C79_1013440 [compost metagenome]